MQNEVVFPEGVIVKEPSSKAPDFILGNVGVNVERFAEWAEKHKNAKGWVFLTIKKSKKGGYYAQLDTWKPPQEEEKKTDDVVEDYENMPF